MRAQSSGPSSEPRRTSRCSRRRGQTVFPGFHGPAAPAAAELYGSGENEYFAMAYEGVLNRCPGCGGSSLDPGIMSQDVRWHRSNQWISTGWSVKAFVCLDCGMLTQHVSASDLEKLRAKNA